MFKKHFHLNNCMLSTIFVVINLIQDFGPGVQSVPPTTYYSRVFYKCFVIELLVIILYSIKFVYSSNVRDPNLLF